MTSYKLKSSGDCPFWKMYVDSIDNPDYVRGLAGFKCFVEILVPTATVTGTTRNGLTLEFPSEQELTMFILRWS